MFVFMLASMFVTIYATEIFLLEMRGQGGRSLGLFYCLILYAVPCRYTVWCCKCVCKNAPRVVCVLRVCTWVYVPVCASHATYCLLGLRKGGGGGWNRPIYSLKKGSLDRACNLWPQLVCIQFPSLFTEKGSTPPPPPSPHSPLLRIRPTCWQGWSQEM